MRHHISRRRGLSPVIATIILSGVVLAVGGAVWSFSIGAAARVSEDYVNDTLDMVNEVIERFTVEHVSYDSATDTLNVWVYNYGDIKIMVDLYAETDTESGSTFDTILESKTTGLVSVDFSGDPLESTDEVSIKVYSRRQNFAYYTYYVP
jgi:flagellin-like protein